MKQQERTSIQAGPGSKKQQRPTAMPSLEQFVLHSHTHSMKGKHGKHFRPKTRTKQSHQSQRTAATSGLFIHNHPRLPPAV